MIPFQDPRIYDFIYHTIQGFNILGCVIGFIWLLCVFLAALPPQSDWDSQFVKHQRNLMLIPLAMAIIVSFAWLAAFDNNCIH